MHVAIVGGGITGCVSAYECVRRGYRVTLYEMSKELGGIMRDIRVGGSWYFSGCHYLDRGTQWFEDLRALLDFEFIDFPHEYGSLTNLVGEKVIDHDFAQPVFSGPMGELRPKDCQATSITGRLSLYPTEVAEPLTGWATGFGDIFHIHANCIDAMQLGRIFYRDSIEAVRREKQTSPLADRVLGLPRSVLFPKTPKAVGSLPSGGYDAFFAVLKRWLLDAGVDIRIGTAVAPLKEAGGGLTFRAARRVVEADRIVWCTNPTALLISAGIGKLDSPVSEMVCFAADLVGSPPPNPVYYQIFSESTAIVRIFLYALGATARVTVEAFARSQTEDKLVLETNQTLADLGLRYRAASGTLVRQKRFVNYTIRDLDIFRRFETRAPDLNVVPGGWQYYSRDGKIEAIRQGMGF